MDFFSGKDRVAVVVTTDGRRVTVPVERPDSNGVSLLDLLRSLLAGLEGLLGLLITGSRRENGGTRRDGSQLRRRTPRTEGTLAGWRGSLYVRWSRDRPERGTRQPR